jgi:hypothetical protein
MKENRGITGFDELQINIVEWSLAQRHRGEIPKRDFWSLTLAPAVTLFND